MSIERALVVSWPDYSGFPASGPYARGEKKKKKKENQRTMTCSYVPLVVLYDYVKFAKRKNIPSSLFFSFSGWIFRSGSDPLESIAVHTGKIL